jgi:hypothetical protein
MTFTHFAAALLALAVFCSSEQAARAGCFELVGCPQRDQFSDFDLSLIDCDRLNFIRNSIFAEKGYCFRHPKFRQMFGVYECQYETAVEVPLSAIERENILKIRRAEAEKGCPR